MGVWGKVKKYFDSEHWQKTVVVLALGVIFLVGLVTVIQKVQDSLPDFSKLTHFGGSGEVKNYEVASIKDADFNYFVPGKDKDWEFDEASPAYDKAKHVVKYVVTLNNAQVNVTFSQQKFPDALKPRGSTKFMAFINDSNPTRSQEAGRGTVYFLGSLENGVPSAGGTNTIIFATDDVLMFGKAGKIIGYDGWAKLLSTMKPH